jgi:GNAT superfamily N-acetyltransferase
MIGGQRLPANDPRYAAAIASKLQEIDNALLELGDAPSQDKAQNQSPHSANINVTIGTSDMVARIPSLVENITTMVNDAYGYMRIDEDDVMERLAMGDPGSSQANRVLHIAFLGERPVGCMSSTFKVPWAERGCGHWGLLVVDTSMQGRGVASLMIAAAELRLAGMCTQIQMEYEYTPRDALSERLLAWYEGPKCGFRCVSGPPRGGGREFRKCRKMIPDDLQRKGERLRLLDLKAELTSTLQALSKG